MDQQTDRQMDQQIETQMGSYLETDLVSGSREYPHKEVVCPS